MCGDASSNSLADCTANIVDNGDSPQEANLICFAAFADKHTGTLYNDLTGAFSPQGQRLLPCGQMQSWPSPFVVFSNKIIFAAYKQQYEMLESMGHVIRLNFMDSQASQTIKEFLTKNQCELMLVEPHNHRVNAAERAIQTFKDHFVSMIATTDSKFPL
jgi:hypothetical protein